MNRLAVWVAVPVALITAALVVVLATSDVGGDSDTDLVGELAPVLASTDATGADFDIDDHRGRWVVVNFFATWCAPCVQEHPELVTFERQTDRDEVTIVSVAFNDSAENVADFFDRNGGEWPVLLDERLAIDWSVAQVPESFIVAPNGRVAAHVTGGVTAANLSEAIAELGSR